MFHLQNELTIFIVRLNNLIIIRDFKSKNELKINPSKYLFICLYKSNFRQTTIHLLSEELNIAGYNAPTIKYPAMCGK